MIKFYIRKPTFKDPSKKIKSGNGSRKTFAIYKQIVQSNSTINETINSKEIDAVNEQYLNGVIGYDLAVRNITKIQSDLYRQIGVNNSPDVFNNQNQKILNSYWDKVYKDRELIDENAAWNKLQRAVIALGNVSLISATKNELQKQIESKQFKNNKQREVVGKLNCLLKFLNRDVKLNRKRKERHAPKYLNETEMLKVSRQIESISYEFSTLVKLAFYSGCRLGELFALSKDSFRNGVLFIDTQIDSNNVERDPKWQSSRKSFLVPQGKQAFDDWVAVKSKMKISRTGISRLFSKTCRLVFDDAAKHCKFHDLRHSYAIHLLSKNINLTLVAQSLGNSVVVAQEYYAGFTLNDETIESIRTSYLK